MRAARDRPDVPIRIFQSALGTTEDAEIVLNVPCNNDCNFCSAKYFSLEPPLQQIRYQLMKAVEVGVRRVNFTGGEPTLRKDLPDILAYARRLGIPGIYLKTNGRKLRDLDFARRLVDSGVTTLQISLHGSHAALHDEIVQTPGAFDEMLEGLANAVTLPVKVNTLSVTVRQNFRDLPDLARLVAGYPIQAHYFAHVYPVGAAWTRFEEVVPTFEETAPYQIEAFHVLAEAGVVGTVDNLPPCFTPGYEGWQNLLYYKDLPNRIYHRKGPGCATCIYDAFCEGVTRQYAEKRGFGELRPVTAREPSGVADRPVVRLAAGSVARLEGVLREKPEGGTLFRAPQVVMLTRRGVGALRRARDGQAPDPGDWPFLLSLAARGLARIDPKPALVGREPAAEEDLLRDPFEVPGLRMPAPYPRVLEA